ncbi:hypothetical protein [Mycoplasmopsis agassizii]|nr:hypothetical protein [Mycoplasmopsis agassizii]
MNKTLEQFEEVTFDFENVLNAEFLDDDSLLQTAANVKWTIICRVVINGSSVENFENLELNSNQFSW